MWAWRDSRSSVETRTSAEQPFTMDMIVSCLVVGARGTFADAQCSYFASKGKRTPKHMWLFLWKVEAKGLTCSFTFFRHRLRDNKESTQWKFLCMGTNTCQDFAILSHGHGALKSGEVCLKDGLIELDDKRLNSLANSLDVVLCHHEFVGVEKLAISYYGRHSFVCSKRSKAKLFYFIALRLAL